MCLAQGPRRSDAGEAQPVAPRSGIKHSTTEPRRSPCHAKEQTLINLKCTLNHQNSDQY